MRLENMSNGVRVRIGSADRMLNTGRHEYVIKYLTTRQIGFFPDFDELYWNATGNGWNFGIDRAEARITLPERRAVPAKRLLYRPAGRQRSRRQHCRGAPRPYRVSHHATAAAAQRLGCRGGLGERRHRAAKWLAANALVARRQCRRAGRGPGPSGGAGLLLLAWLRVGRDPPRGTIIPLFGPPKGMSAAAVRYVNNFGFDQRCFTAAVVDLGVNGHLKITGGGSDKPVLAHRKGGKPVPPAETAMVGKLFASKSSLVLDQVNHQTLSGAESALSEGLKKAYLGKLFTNNFGLAGFGLLIVIILIGLVLISLIESHNSRSTGGLVVGVLLPLLFIIGGAGMIYEGVQRNPISLWRVIVGALLAGIAALAGLFLVKQNGYGWVDFIPAIATYVAASVTGMAFPWLQAPSVEGRQIMDQIEGFREYFGVAEEDRLECAQSPGQDARAVRALPALRDRARCRERLGPAFCRRACGGRHGGGRPAVATSTWYAGSGNWSSDPVGFANHLGSDLSQTISSASTAPGSSDSGDGGGSGSGGGGSSGGGGGGGGGGGW